MTHLELFNSPEAVAILAMMTDYVGAFAVLADVLRALYETGWRPPGIAETPVK